MEQLLIEALNRLSPNTLSIIALLYFGLLRPLQIGNRAGALSGYIRRALVMQRRKVVALEKLEEAIVKVLLDNITDL